MLAPGKKLPKFKLPDQSGAEKTYADVTWRKGAVIYVYSKDHTSG